MSATKWLDVISRITAQTPDDLDPILAPLDPRHHAESGAFHFPVEAAVPVISTPFGSDDVVCFGARVTESTPDPLRLAMVLAQMAAEKAAHPVILAHVDVTGLEKFGFRVERVAGSTDAERNAAEEQLKRFWNIVLVI